MTDTQEQIRLLGEDGGEAEKLLLAGLGGLLVGALAGVLLAPDRGSETRRRIRDSIVSCCATCRERLGPLLRCTCGEATEGESGEAD
jgi:hypothetical protein